MSQNLFARITLSYSFLLIIKVLHSCPPCLSIPPFFLQNQTFIHPVQAYTFPQTIHNHIYHKTYYFFHVHPFVITYASQQTPPLSLSWSRISNRIQPIYLPNLMLICPPKSYSLPLYLIKQTFHLLIYSSTIPSLTKLASIMSSSPIPVSQPSPSPSNHQPSVSFLSRLFAIRPFFSSHPIAEAGASLWIRTEFILLYRLIATSTLTFTSVLFTATRDISLHTLGAWTYFFAALAFCFATFTSLTYLLSPNHASDPHSKSKFAFLPNLTVPFIQIATTLQIVASPLYWVFLRATTATIKPVEILLYVIAPLLLVLDIFLSFRMSFRLSYVLLAPFAATSWLAYAWIRQSVTNTWPYPEVTTGEEPPGKSVAFHLAFLLGTIFAGFCVLFVNRLNKLEPVARLIQKQVAMDHAASDTSGDVESLSDRALDKIMAKTDVNASVGAKNLSPTYLPDGKGWSDSKCSSDYTSTPEDLS